jgi:hypothetical protein
MADSIHNFRSASGTQNAHDVGFLLAAIQRRLNDPNLLRMAHLTTTADPKDWFLANGVAHPEQIHLASTVAITSPGRQTIPEPVRLSANIWHHPIGSLGILLEAEMTHNYTSYGKKVQEPLQQLVMSAIEGLETAIRGTLGEVQYHAGSQIPAPLPNGTYRNSFTPGTKKSAATFHFNAIDTAAIASSLVRGGFGIGQIVKGKSREIQGHLGTTQSIDLDLLLAAVRHRFSDPNILTIANNIRGTHRETTLLAGIMATGDDQNGVPLIPVELTVYIDHDPDLSLGSKEPSSDALRSQLRLGFGARIPDIYRLYAAGTNVGAKLAGLITSVSECFESVVSKNLREVPYASRDLYARQSEIPVRGTFAIRFSSTAEASHAGFYFNPQDIKPIAFALSPMRSRIGRIR